MEEGTKQAVMAFARLACSLAASAAAMAGFALDADALYTGAALAAALVAYVWSWWENNNVTRAAQDAQGFLDVAKACEARRAPEDGYEEAGE